MDGGATEPGEAALRVEGVNFSYGSVQVLFDVSVEVRPGEVFCLIGPNGAGKTTFLRVVAGLEHQHNGRLSLFGADISRLSTEDRVRNGLGAVFGGQGIFPDLTVHANLLAGGQLLASRRLLDERIAEAYETFPALAQRRRSLAVELSGGEQQMLALARAFLLRPKLLCIDELSMGLAPVLVGRLLEVLRRFKQEGTTLLLVEQSVKVAAEIADRAAFFEKGEVQIVADAASLFENRELLQSMFLKTGRQT